MVGAILLGLAESKRTCVLKFYVLCHDGDHHLVLMLCSFFLELLTFNFYQFLQQHFNDVLWLSTFLVCSYQTLVQNFNQFPSALYVF